jgi:hypothetical protein
VQAHVELEDNVAEEVDEAVVDVGVEVVEVLGLVGPEDVEVAEGVGEAGDVDPVVGGRRS